MRFVIGALLALCLAFIPVDGEAAKGRPKAQEGPMFPSAEAILKWIHGYRHEPQPEKVAMAVQAMSGLGLFRDLEGAGVYVGFMAGVIGDPRNNAEGLVASMFPLPPEEQVALIRAIAYSGRPDWKEIMGKFVERMPARKVLIERFLYDKLPTLQQLPMDKGPITLDTLWGVYFATGSADPVLRLVSVLEWSKEANDIEKLTVGSMVKWTLATNASRDTELLALIKGIVNHEPPKTAVILNEVIEAVEMFETGRIRKDAVAAIEEIKRKGPATNRQVAWWAQAAPTLIGLGCVAAAVTGQVQFGLPCVIGGPVATAAGRFLTPQP